MARNYDEIAVISLLKPILEINAEDKQKNKELQAENERLQKLAAEFIKKCDELEKEKKKLEGEIILLTLKKRT